MNDGKCDPLGRYRTGTMALDHVTAVASLYKVDPDLRVTTMLTGVVVSNGLGWSPDNSKLYYNDTIARHVEAFDFDLAGGTIRNRRYLIDFSDGPGAPDGMAVDVAGCLWIAAWGGWCIRRYRQDGTLDLVVELPVAKVTSCCFGGTGLSGDLRHDVPPRAGRLRSCSTTLGRIAFPLRAGGRGASDRAIRRVTDMAKLLVLNGPNGFRNTAAKGEPKFAAVSQLITIPAPWELDGFTVVEGGKGGRLDLVASVSKNLRPNPKDVYFSVDSQLWLYRRKA
jgi:hypothetical protein